MSVLFRAFQEKLITLDGWALSKFHRQTEKHSAIALQRAGFIFLTAMYSNNVVKQTFSVPKARF